MFCPHVHVCCRHFFLTDPSTNSVLGWAKASLSDAEAFGFDHPEAAAGWATGATAPAGGAADAAAPPQSAAADGSGDDKATAAPPPVPKALATATKFMNKYKQKNGSGAEGGSGALVAAAPEPYDPEEAGQLVEIPFMAPQK